MKPVTLNISEQCIREDLSDYRTMGPILGYYWNYLCGAMGRLGSGMASWIVLGLAVRVSDLVLEFVSDVSIG